MGGPGGGGAKGGKTIATMNNRQLMRTFMNAQKAIDRTADNTKERSAAVRQYKSLQRQMANRNAKESAKFNPRSVLPKIGPTWPRSKP